MRIGIISAEYPPMQGGVGAYSNKLAHELVAMGHEIFLFTTADGIEQHEAIHITRWSGDWNWRSWGAITTWVNKHHIRIVNLQFQTAAYGMSPWIHFLQNRLPIPLVTTFHDLRHPYLFPKAGVLRDWIVMYLARSSAGTIVTNHEDYARIYDQANVSMIPIGSNVMAERPKDYEAVVWRNNLGIKVDDFVIAHFGFMNHSKGINTLLDAIAIANHDIPIQLLMIGGKTGSSDATNVDYANQIEAQVEALSIGQIVHWTGFVDDDAVSAYLWAADLLVLPYHDGASFRRGSLMAALEHNCAIISTIPSVKIDEFKHKQNIYLVEPDNKNDLADAIKYLHAHPNEIDRLKFGAAEIKSTFNWELIAKNTIKFFERVLKDYHLR